MLEAVLSVLVLATIALAGGAVLLWRRGVRRQAGLMALLAVIAAANVAIWTVPGAGGDTPIDRIDEETR
jgi:hypothetical protein